MTAGELIAERISPEYQARAWVKAFVNDGKDWYHVHKDEELPEGHIQIAGLDYAVDIYWGEEYPIK